MDGLQYYDVHAIINPISGLGSKHKIPSLLKDAYTAHSLSLNITFTEYVGHAGELAKQAIKQGAKYILAVGGDGTVNEIAAAMIHSDVVLGIIPKGSGNGLARELNIPLGSKQAIELLLAGKVTTIDACKANDRIFFTVCGVGFDAEVSRRFSSDRRRGSVSYVKKSVTEFLNYEPETYELVTDNGTIQEKAFLVACANASQYGNNAYIAPYANLRDGKMDVTVLSPFTLADIPSLALQLFTRQLDKNSKVKIFQTDRLSIHRSQPGMMHLDGEPVATGERIDLSVIPNALKVLIPEAPPSKGFKNYFEQVTVFFNRELPAK